MYLLDTNSASALLNPGRANANLGSRVRSTPMDDLCISIITVEEMLRGVLNLVRRSQEQDQVAGYELLKRLIYDLNRFAILPFSYEAESIYNAFDSSVRRIGTQDCRIAAIALAFDCIVITANTQHFSKIPALKYEDWTKDNLT